MENKSLLESRALCYGEQHVLALSSDVGELPL